MLLILNVCNYSKIFFLADIVIMGGQLRYFINTFSLGWCVLYGGEVILD
jgi:hypothetical protein